MPRGIPDSLIEEIRQHSDIATVIGAYFHLQRAGTTFKALCPFHKEKTPSFTVNPVRQFYHCFGCNAGGDVFKFVMEYEKVDFMTAVRMLAQKANIRIEIEERSATGGPNKETLYAINEKTARHYQQILLQAAEAAPARDYLKRRQLPESAIADFTIGFAPDAWDTILLRAAKQYSIADLEAAGLVVTARPDDGTPGTGPARERRYDRFRNRLMFAIHDEQGRVIGFSGRILDKDASPAKYINTPETPLFRKSRVLYALHRARQAILEAHQAILCEGQIDVIRCHLAGFTRAVAAQGTAFTEEHARILKRYADDVILVFDADTAGQNASLRTAAILFQAGLAVRIAALPEGEDPDSLILNKGGDAFQKLLDGARSVLDFQIDVLSARDNRASEAGLMRITAAVLDMIRRQPNAVYQAKLLQEASSRLQVPEEALQRELRRGTQAERRPEQAPAGPEPVPAVGPGAMAGRPAPPGESALAEHLIAEPALAGLVRQHLPLDMITTPLIRQLIQAILDAETAQRDVMAVLSERDTPDRALSTFAAGVLAAPSKIKSAFATHEESLKSLILGIRTQALQHQRKALDARLRASRSGTGPKLSAKEEKLLETEYLEIGMILAKMKSWATALPIL
ncbi:MAG: DNA primase [Lentisphaerae bacterium]|nr:DNA primase [Lentisphaerota bacterium]